MKRLKLYRSLAVLTLVIALSSSIASDLEADTLRINGTFHMDQLGETTGADLTEVFAHGNEHTWSLTLYGVTYSYYRNNEEWDEDWGYGHDYQSGTFVHATSFDFQFFGLDANVLNAVVSQQLTGGGLVDDAYFELVNSDYFDSDDIFGGGLTTAWLLRLQPLDLAGVSFSAGAWSLYSQPNPYRFSTDENGYPVVEPQRLLGDVSIRDDRPGNHGGLGSNGDFVDIEVTVFVLPGDFNDDSRVDGLDFLKWQRGESPHPGSAADLADWESHFGAPTSLSAASTIVPEPASLAILALGLPLLGWRNSRNARRPPIRYHHRYSSVRWSARTNAWFI